jgi:hypothetical protein
MWDWHDIAKTAIGAGLGTAIVTAIAQIVVPFFRDRRNRKRQGAYMAMRLAVALEAYASGCLTLLRTNQFEERLAAVAGQEPVPWVAPLLELPPFPDDADGWKAIDPKLAGRCLNFRNRIFESQLIIDAALNIDTRSREMGWHARNLALEAWDIAVDLRDKHGIPKADPVWDYIRVLRGAEDVRELDRIRRAAPPPAPDNPCGNATTGAS